MRKHLGKKVLASTLVLGGVVTPLAKSGIGIQKVQAKAGHEVTLVNTVMDNYKNGGTFNDKVRPIQLQIKSNLDEVTATNSYQLVGEGTLTKVNSSIDNGLHVHLYEITFDTPKQYLGEIKIVEANDLADPVWSETLNFTIEQAPLDIRVIQDKNPNSLVDISEEVYLSQDQIKPQVQVMVRDKAKVVQEVLLNNQPLQVDGVIREISKEVLDTNENVITFELDMEHVDLEKVVGTTTLREVQNIEHELTFKMDDGTENKVKLKDLFPKFVYDKDSPEIVRGLINQSGIQKTKDSILVNFEVKDATLVTDPQGLKITSPYGTVKEVKRGNAPDTSIVVLEVDRDTQGEIGTISVFLEDKNKNLVNASTSFVSGEKIQVDKEKVSVNVRVDTPLIEKDGMKWSKDIVNLVFETFDEDIDDTDLSKVEVYKDGVRLTELVDYSKYVRDFVGDAPKRMTVEVEENGEYNLQYRFRDKVGNLTDLITIPTFRIDKDKPQWVSVEEKENKTSSNDSLTYIVKIKEAYFDKENSHVKVFGEQLFTDWKQVGEFWQMEVQATKEGTPRIEVVLYDKAGNVLIEERDMVGHFIDKTAPNVVITKETQEKITKGKVVYSVVLSDEHLGSQDRIKVNKGVITNYVQESPTLVKFNVEVDEELDDTSIQLEVADTLGNKVIKNAPENVDEVSIIDRTAPTIRETKVFNGTFTLDTNQFNETQVLTYRIEDKYLDSDTLVVRGIPTLNVTKTKVNDTTLDVEIRVVDEGTYDIQFDIQDKAGNVSTHIVDTFIVDKTQAEGALKIETQNLNAIIDGYFGSMIELVVTIKDTGFDPNKVSIQTPNATFKNGTWEYDATLGLYRNIMLLQQDGTYTPKVQIIDKAGNITIVETSKVVIDKVAPKVVLKGLDLTQQDNGVVFVRGGEYKPTVTLEIEDEHIDVLDTRQVNISVPVKEWKHEGTKHIAILDIEQDRIVDLDWQVKDKAGNEYVKPQELGTKVYIDSVKPTVTYTQITPNDNTTDSEVIFIKNPKYEIVIEDKALDLDTIEVQSTQGQVVITKPFIKQVGVDKVIGEVEVQGEGKHQIQLRVMDKAGNSSDWVKSDPFAIDTTPPKVLLSGLGNNRKHGLFYNTPQTLTITVEETNFDPNKVEITPNRSLTWDKVGENTYVAKVNYDENVKQHFEIKVKDKVNIASGVVVSDEIIVDTINPVLTLTPIGEVHNGKYYNQDAQYRLDINEEHFNGSEVVVQGGAVSGFTTNGSTHSAIITATQSGKINVSYTDLAGNAAQSVQSDEFVIDRDVPTITISGVTQGQVFYKDVQINVGLEDENLDSNATTVTLRNTSTGNVVELSKSEDGKSWAAPTTLFTNEKIVDGVYVLEVNGVDLATNKSQETLTFVINRFGSDFETKPSEWVGSYHQSLGDDFTIQETSLTRLSNQTITITRNGVSLDLVQGQDYEISEQEIGNGVYRYIYTLKKDLFNNQDGVYNVGIVTEDGYGNVNNLTDKLSEVSFVVDKTKPEISYNIENGKVYNEAQKEVSILLQDGYGIENYSILVNGVEVVGTNAITLVNETNLRKEYKVVLKDSANTQMIEVRLKDKAGNEVVGKVEVTVTTNWWLNFRASNYFIPAMLSGIGTLIGLVLWLFFIVGKKRNKKEDSDIDSTEISKEE